MAKLAKMKPPGDFARQEDSRIIAACLEGDPAAWEALIVRYQRLVYSIPVKARLSQDDAADIFQSVCMKLYENLAALREHEKISAWLITTTTRECWRFVARQRRKGSMAFSEDDSDGPNQIPAKGLLADEQQEALERQHIIRQAVGALPDKCRNLITMLFYQKDELSYTDIADRMDMPVSSIGPTRARCLEKLKRLLKGKI